MNNIFLLITEPNLSEDDDSSSDDSATPAKITRVDTYGASSTTSHTSSMFSITPFLTVVFFCSGMQYTFIYQIISRFSVFSGLVTLIDKNYFVLLQF